jgi:hypothetical protein
MKNTCAELRECVGKLRYAKNRNEEEVVELHDRAINSADVMTAELAAHARHDKYTEASIAELEDHIKQLECQLKEVGDELLRENKRANQATRHAEDRCVNAILNGNQFFLAGIEPEIREAVVRRALNL